jgi:hypothetical protein
MKPLALRLFVFAVLLVLAAAWTKEGLSSFLPPLYRSRFSCEQRKLLHQC